MTDISATDDAPRAADDQLAFGQAARDIGKEWRDFGLYATGLIGGDNAFHIFLAGLMGHGQVAFQIMGQCADCLWHHIGQNARALRTPDHQQVHRVIARCDIACTCAVKNRCAHRVAGEFSVQPLGPFGRPCPKG